MTQPQLLLEPREVADTSLIAYRRIAPTLNKREVATFLGLCDLCTRQVDATGGELAESMRMLITSVRPRLTGLEAKGWITKTPARKSKATAEGVCHGYVPAVPRESVARMQQALAKKS